MYKVTSDVAYVENAPADNAVDLLKATWNLYYYGVACNDDHYISGQGWPIYDHAAGLFKALLHAAYPDVDTDRAYGWITEAGELFSGDELRHLVEVDHC